MKELVKLRQEVKKRKPRFVRYLARRYKKLRKTGYRRPKGRHNKMRLRIYGKPRMVSASYGAPVKARGLHPSGYREVVVHNIKELENVDPKVFAVRIASTVGTKKKMELIKKAEELGIKVLNPRIKRKSWLELKRREERKKKKEERKEEEKEKGRDESGGEKEKRKEVGNAEVTKAEEHKLEEKAVKGKRKRVQKKAEKGKRDDVRDKKKQTDKPGHKKTTKKGQTQRKGKEEKDEVSKRKTQSKG